MTGPTIRRGKSFQSYSTPPEFIAAVERRFGKLAWDLAATAENAKAPRFYTKEQNSLLQHWNQHDGTLFCNPPYEKITPWAEKAARYWERPDWTLLLVPASVGANWFQYNLVPRSYILELSPRLCFDGKNPYPKDLVLAAFGFGIRGRGYWKWKE